MKKVFSFFFKHHLLTLACAVVSVIVVMIGCSMPGKELPSFTLVQHVDKLLHFTCFIGMAWLWSVYALSLKKKWWQVIIAMFSYGVFIEFYQKQFVPGRNFDVWDIVADTIGAMCSWFFMPKDLRK